MLKGFQMGWEPPIFFGAGQSNRQFSNFFQVQEGLRFNGRIYSSVEQAYQYTKAQFFRDFDVAAAIYQTDDPHLQKSWSRDIDNFKTL